MVGKSYVNQIQEQNVSLAIQQLLVADYGTSWTPGRIDVESVPSGFAHAGAVVEDTPQVTLKRGKFELKTGIPQVLQYQAVTGVDGMLQMQLHSFSWRQMQLALGNMTYTSSPTLCGTISSITGLAVYTAASTSVLASIVAGRQIVMALVGGQDKIDAFETVVQSVAADGKTFSIDPLPPTSLPAATAIYFYNFAKQAGGTALIKKYRILAVADLINGVQVVHDFQKVTSGEEIAEELRPAQNARIPIMFNAHGYKTSDYGSNSELIVFERYYFPKGV